MFIKMKKMKKMSAYAARLWREIPFLQCVIISLLLNFVIEIICRRSFISAVVFTFTRPIFFLSGFSLILLTMSLALFFRKRVFVYVLISAVWAVMGITNCVLILIRTAPFEAVDFSIVKTGLGIITVYMEIWQIVLIAAAILSVIGLIIFLGIRLKRQKFSLRAALIGFSSSAVLCLAIILPLNLTETYPDAFSNLAESYDSYGFIYCFTCSIFDRGVDEPDGYSRETMENLAEQIDADCPVDVTDTPNIIFLQLESFIDVNRLAGVTYSEDPVPFFRSLKENYTSGLLTVPTIGAGTANTEFEVITGMSHHDFGTGEYPYKSFLNKYVCESVPFLLSDYGYSSHAIHNYTATFYNRNSAYSSLGFDTFTPMEYMTNLEYNSLGWAKDKILTRQILDALNSTESQDVILTISVQGHGKYAAADNPAITAVSDTMEREQLDNLIFFLNEMADMDKFLRELTEALSSFGEEVVLVMYGDHLPSLGFEESDFSVGNLFQTEYVIWSNYGLAENDRDLASYQLAAYTMAQADISCGNVIRLHQSMLAAGIESYQEDLRLVEYDILYGKKYLYGGSSPYERTEMQMGVLPIAISGISSDGTAVYGTNFTEWSIIYLNGKKQDTEYVSETEIRLKTKEIKSGDIVFIRQIAKDGSSLGDTPYYTVP